MINEVKAWKQEVSNSYKMYRLCKKHKMTWILVEHYKSATREAIKNLSKVIKN
jgi:hypothetical protein